MDLRAERLRREVGSQEAGQAAQVAGLEAQWAGVRQGFGELEGRMTGVTQAATKVGNRLQVRAAAWGPGERCAWLEGTGLCRGQLAEWRGFVQIHNVRLPTRCRWVQMQLGGASMLPPPAVPPSSGCLQLTPLRHPSCVPCSECGAVPAACLGRD